MKLNNYERLALWNQYEILKELKPDDVRMYEDKQEVLQSNWEPLFAFVIGEMSDEMFPASKAQFVYNVLDMFDALQRYEQKVGQKLEHHAAHFRGFDGHGDLVGFAQFNVERLGRWKYLEIAEFDAHMPIEAMYERMLEVWMKKPEGLPRFELTMAEVDAILAASIHPENRAT